MIPLKLTGVERVLDEDIPPPQPAMICCGCQRDTSIEVGDGPRVNRGAVWKLSYLRCDGSGDDYMRRGHYCFFLCHECIWRLEPAYAWLEAVTAIWPGLPRPNAAPEPTPDPAAAAGTPQIHELTRDEVTLLLLRLQREISAGDMADKLLRDHRVVRRTEGATEIEAA